MTDTEAALVWIEQAVDNTDMPLKVYRTILDALQHRGGLQQEIAYLEGAIYDAGYKVTDVGDGTNREWVLTKLDIYG